MFTSEIKVRVRYSETDRMGYVYYGNYAGYFEVGRVEALRQLGLNYKDLEEGGIMLPVYEFGIKYLKPAHYDDLLTIRTSITEMPGASIHFGYETLNEAGELINVGNTSLVFINRETSKPVGAPKDFLEMLEKYF